MLLKMNNKKLYLGFIIPQLWQIFKYNRGNIIKYYKFSHLICITFFYFQCKKVFPRRQNYHFHRTKGRCPGAPQPPKYHKLYESKYYCVHPDCGSGDGELRDNTPCFTSRGT